MSGILIVGESWGDKEEMFQHPFIGPAGRELSNMLSDAGFCSKVQAQWPSEIDMIHFWKNLKEEKNIHLANVFNAHPEDNNVDLFFGAKTTEVCTDLMPVRAGKYLLKEHRHHYDALLELILTLKPDLIITVGATSTWAVAKAQKISEVRGTIIWSDDFNVKILPTYHPSAVLRNWSLRTIAVADLVKAWNESQFKEVRRTKRFVLINPTLEEIEDWINKPADIYSVDIETAYMLYSNAEKTWMAKNAPFMLGMLSRQISMVGIARTTTDALVIPIMERIPALNGEPATLNYWKTQQEEVRAWKLLQKAMRKQIPKLFQNGMFDIQRLLEAGVRVLMAREDTMILHHAILPEFSKGLGFLGSLYSSEPAWKQMGKLGDSLKKDN